MELNTVCTPTFQVLFRPVIEKSESNSEAYTIEAYDGNITIRTEEFKKMSAEQVQAALFFFSNLGKGLLRTLPSFLMEQIEEIKKQ